jgi:hypothetical protein
MLEWYLVLSVASFAGGWFVRNHIGNIATDAASAVTAATVIHTSSPALNAAVAGVGTSVASAVKSAGTAAAATPAAS